MFGLEPGPDFLKFNLVELATLIVTTLGAVAGGVWALTQWAREQKWRRLQAIFERIRSFDETPGTRNAMMILKAPRAEIPLWDPVHPPPSGLYEWVTWEEAAQALALDGYKVVHINSRMGAIRNSFEDFLNRMTQIEIYLDSGLLTPREVVHLVKPWVVRIKCVPDDGLSDALLNYMKEHHKYAAIRLFSRPEFNLPGPAKPEAPSAAVKRSAAAHPADQSAR